MEIKKINEQKNPLAPENIDKFIGKKKKHYLPIILVGAFLIVFLGSLVFEFYHIVNKATPSLGLDENNQELEVESSSNFQKITQFFSQLFEKKEAASSQSDNKNEATEETSEELLEGEISVVENSAENIQEDNNSQIVNNTKEENSLVDPRDFKTIPSNKEDHKFSLQLMAVKEKRLSDLKKIAQILIDKNYYAYIYRTPYKVKAQFSDEKDHYYRLRVGFFKTKSDAVKIAYDLISQYPKIFKNYFVALPLKEEYESDFFLFSPESE
jgi:hypothetical protein